MMRMLVWIALVGIALPAMANGMKDPPAGPIPPPQYTQQYAPPHGSPSGKCAAVAISTTPGKYDGWGAQSIKDTCEAAVADAVRFCEKNLIDQGYINPTCEKVARSHEWVVGIACSDDRGYGWPLVGTGSSPAQAIERALSGITGHVPGVRCVAPVIRHGSIRKEEFHTRTWSVQLSCSNRMVAAGHPKGFTALTRALIACGRSSIANARVIEARY